MPTLDLATDVVDRDAYDRSVARCRENRVVLPTFAELAAPETMSAERRAALNGLDHDDADPRNLLRVHWYNTPWPDGDFLTVPDHVVLPPSLTGVAAPIVVLPADRFPMVHAHKVLAAYACLAPRLVTGQFDPTHHRAVWPSTGNYCRGGVAISRLMGCHGVAVLPEGMSRERFQWLERWVTDPDDIVRTPGTESNVKEIYDRCAELGRDPRNIVFNQFAEYANHLVHWLCTGRALERVFEALQRRNPDLRLRAFVAASGSAGTLAAGDALKERHGTAIVAVEALECPTLLSSGFGSHNIQGIGDKHVPLIHNVMNTDFVVAVSDRTTDALGVLFDEPKGRAYLERRREVPPAILTSLGRFGLSSICNVVAAIKLAKHQDLGPQDVILTVATDSAEMYGSERERTLRRRFPHGFDDLAAAETTGEHLLGAASDHVLELDHADRQRIFNLGYFTWVEQQGVPLADFTAREDQSFWRGLRDLLPRWDAAIEEFNRRTGLVAE